MILCAAIKTDMPNGDPLVIPCRRHKDGYNILRRLSNEVSLCQCEEGFIDTEGRFYDRERAYLQAVICGQIPRAIMLQKDRLICGIGEPRQLFSEDLY